MKRIRSILLACVAALASLGASFTAPQPPPRRLRLANTYDAAIETHEASVRRTNDVAVTARHLLWIKGAADGTVALGTASAAAIGTIDNTETDTGVSQAVLLLGRGPTKKMVAAAAIAAGVNVYQAASGKVTGTEGQFCVGVSLTAAGADGDVIEVNDCVPVDIDEAEA